MKPKRWRRKRARIARYRATPYTSPSGSPILRGYSVDIYDSSVLCRLPTKGIVDGWRIGGGEGEK